jgi:hypothetical protein
VAVAVDVEIQRLIPRTQEIRFDFTTLGNFEPKPLLASRF